MHVVLDSVIDLAKASFGANSRFELLYDPSLPEIDVDPDHLHEAALNLVKNAIEAVGLGSPRQARDLGGDAVSRRIPLCGARWPAGAWRA